MNKKLRKRLGALVLAAAMAVTTLGSVVPVSANSSKAGSLIDFSFPFDFLLFHLEKEADEMTEEEAEAQRDKLREQSVKAEEKAGLKIVYEYTMDEPGALSDLDISKCEGDGIFAFAEPDLVPEKGVTVCEFIFTPSDAEKYDYDQMLGWDEETKILHRYVEVVCSSLAASEENVGDKSEDSIIPEATGTPEITEAPEAIETPDATATPEVTGTPEVTKEPEATGTPEVTKEPEATGTPEVTGTPEDPDPKPGNNLVPEITTIPDAVIPTSEPSATPQPEVTVPINVGSSAESGVQIIRKDEFVKDLEARILSYEESSYAEDDMYKLVEMTKLYEAFTEEQKNAVSSDVFRKLCDLQDKAAEINHESNGVCVAGNIPWFVQLRVNIGNDTENYVPSGLETIVPYDMCLWNLLNDTEYKLAGGEKVTLTMAVPENLHLYDGLTIVHYMDESHYEYIELKILGEMLSFETASFSPFNIAGSTILVGGKPNASTAGKNNGAGSDNSQSSTAVKPSETKPSDSIGTTAPSTDSNKNNTTRPASGHSSNTVKTGDNTNISQVFILAVGAAVVMVLCVVLVVRSKKEEE